MKRPKAVEHRFAARSLADGCEQPMLESLEAAVDEVLLAREVVEDRGRRDLGDAGDLGDADLLEAALAEQAPGGVGQQLPCSLLLSFPASKRAARRRPRSGASGREPPTFGFRAQTIPAAPCWLQPLTAAGTRVGAVEFRQTAAAQLTRATVLA
jgi:hypothetical protein